MCVYDYNCICVPVPKIIISNVQHLTLFTQLHSIMVMCGHTVIFMRSILLLYVQILMLSVFSVVPQLHFCGGCG